MDDITTRRATASDAAALADMATTSYQPHLARMRGQRPAPMDADYAASIARDHVWVAESGGRVAAFVVVVVVVDEPETTLLENVAVHPDWQGRGVGRLLMAIAEEHARATGRPVVRLYTHASMQENQRIYAHLGYAEVGRELEDGLNRVFFEKRVSPS